MPTAAVLLQKKTMAQGHMWLQLWSKEFHALWNTADISIHNNLLAMYSFAPYFMSTQWKAAILWAIKKMKKLNKIVKGIC